MPSFVDIPTNGIKVRAVVEGSGPLVVMVHGFPESWYSWRHQIGPIAEAGFTVCAIDVRGYGGSDKPAEVSDYSLEQITTDVAGVIEHLSADGTGVLIGHDWGAPIVWNTALTRPDRVSAVAGLSVPYTGVPQAMFLDLVKAAFTDRGRFFYQVYFQDVGVAEAELEADVRASLRKFYYAISGDAPDGTWPADKAHGETLLARLPDPDPFPAWLSKADENYFTAEFEGSGFFGPLNRYRNHPRDFAWLQAFKDRKIEQPSLFIGGDRDLVLKMIPGVNPVDFMAPHMTDLRGAHILPGVGHWTQQEAPEPVNRLLLDWLKGL
ncbi:alpha/beta fold hydrolase [Caulobacter mirabilis]|uniref:Epoxide hydrolase n=1 Tax=Caulobacter mirabilis TaxID=69666 RepID=A0A2D2B1H0_9CAUL|nr:alpha/beta hydrolase [Caulobacter mirabilis]ATQ44073.1 epoxide hydrolase [Caulobacter mirabilis]